MANSKKKKKSNKKTFHCPYCKYSERSVRANKFKVCPMCGKELELEYDEEEREILAARKGEE